jgi:uncharacterized protein YcbK (DUF882 family)
MTPILIKLKLMTTAMAGWTAASTPAPLPVQAVATVVAVDAASPIPVALFDENEHQQGTIAVWRDGSTDAATTAEVKQLFRCRTTHRQKMIAKATLAMLADVSQHYPGKTIEYVSAYRTGGSESRTSPHRDGRAIDFRIRGVSLQQIRDYVWKTYTDVGVGWYPSEQFVHIDTRPVDHDMSWTFYKGVNHYNPYWAELARRPQPVVASVHGAGV